MSCLYSTVIFSQGVSAAQPQANKEIDKTSRDSCFILWFAVSSAPDVCILPAVERPNAIRLVMKNIHIKVPYCSLGAGLLHDIEHVVCVPS